MSWNKERLKESVFNFENLDEKTQGKIAEFLGNSFSFDDYLKQVEKKEKAVKNMQNAKNVLLGAKQKFPETIEISNIPNAEALKNYAILIMAGGEGERLRVSLEEKGYSKNDLKDFTKATFPIPNTNYKFGALEVNLKMIAEFCEELKHNIPVIITTGPKNSDTEKIIPKILRENNNFGLKELSTIAQNERFHLTNDNKIVFDGEKAITNPDETGGPIAKLKESGILENCEKDGLKKIMVLQGTAVYSRKVLPTIAKAGENHDGLGIGILRDNFDESDPYGTFVAAENKDGCYLRIVEKDTRNAETYSIKNKDGKFLPYNTGFYVFDIKMLKNVEMPDYATPTKIILENIEKSPKIGYAATDIIAFAEKPAVLAISNDDFHVIKNAEDIDVLAQIIAKFGL